MIAPAAALAASILALSALPVSALAGPLGLDPMVRALPEGSWRSAGACEDCHRDEVADWERSRHRVSWTNELLFEGYVREPLPMCVTCHAPLAEQVAEIEANAAFYQSRTVGPPGVLPLPEPRASEGVTCAVCHFREGRIVSPTPPLVHRDAIVDPDLGQICAACHEFRFRLVRPDGSVGGADPMQATWSEWEAYAAAGGVETCVSCHLPGGRHLFRGAHDQEWLRGALSVEEADGALVLRSVGVGHALPTGDLFRHLTVEVETDDGWTVVDRIGRTYRTGFDPELGGVHKAPVTDTRVLPGEARRVPIPAGARWRVRYHYGSEDDEGMGGLALDEIIVTLWESAPAVGPQ